MQFHQKEGPPMELQKLAKHEHYFHTHSDFFNFSLDLVHAFLMSDYSIGMHEQEFYEINLVTRGKGTHYINNSCVAAEVGDVFIIPPKISHGYVGGSGFDVFHVILSDDFMNKYIADLQLLPSFYTLFGTEPLMRGRTTDTLHLKIGGEELRTALEILRDIAKYQKYNDTAESLIRSNLAMVAISLLCNAYTTLSPEVDLTLSKDRALMKSISFIHERYYEKITIEDLTKIAHISRSSYIKQFKQICNMPPSAYIIKVRVESAASMLQSTNLSIVEIAEKTGFYDASHLTKTFERIYGISPISYKNRKGA